MARPESIIQKRKECYLCREIFGNEMQLRDTGLECHHMIPGTANRQVSDRNGLWVWLCPYHHKFVHSADGSETMKHLKRTAQRAYEQKKDRQSFINEFGRSYL